MQAQLLDRSRVGLGQQERLDVARPRRTTPTAARKRDAERRSAARCPGRSAAAQTALRPSRRPRRSVTGERPRSASRTVGDRRRRTASASRTSSSRLGRAATSTIVGDPPRARRHHDHAVGQEHRLGDRVRDEHDRRARLRADPQQLGLHPLAGHLVQRAERLVHQQQRRAARRARGRSPPAAACRPRAGSGGARRSRPARPARAARAPARAAAPCPRPCSAERQLDVALHGPPLEQPGLLEGDAVVLVQAGLAGPACR